MRAFVVSNAEVSMISRTGSKTYVASRTIVRWLAAALAGMSIGAVDANADTALITGVNLPHFAWQKESLRSSTLASVASNKVHNVRISLIQPVKMALASIKEAHDKGLGVLLQVQLDLPQYYPPGTPPRPGLGRVNNVRRLSAMDPKRFEATFTPLLKEIDSSGVNLVGIEIGNEINWAGFNGDFGADLGRGAGSVQSNPGKMEQIRKGLQNYVAVVAAARRARDNTANLRTVPLISAGLAPFTAKVASALGGDELEIGATLSMLRDLGIDRLIDAYGVHFYPGGEPDSHAVSRALEQTLSVCDKSKPCWITEWSVPTDASSCSFGDERKNISVGLNEVIEREHGEGRVAAAFWFDWSGDKFALFRCGHTIFDLGGR